MNFLFHVVPSDHPLLRYQHEYVSLCEGLRELGYTFYGTAEYWQEPEKKQFLIHKAPVSFVSDVAVYNTYYFAAFPEAIKEVDYSRINILIDREDGLYGTYGHPMFKKFNLILRTHYNGHINYTYYHPNIKPWAFGLSNRIMKAVDDSFDEPTIDRILVNFRIAHQLRDKAAHSFVPFLAERYPVFNRITNEIGALGTSASTTEYDRINWEQSGHRHDPAYYRLLNTSILTSTFGGFVFLKPFATNRIVRQGQHFYGLLSKILKGLGKDDAVCYFIDQYDSWRLWEAFYAKTCPVHMDFEYWKWILPVMPKNKVHYWGVSGFRFEQSAQELLEMHRDDILQIANQGRTWSAANYGPVPVADRFLKLVKELEKRGDF
jgi:hypothetical protein